jgi:predicted metal-dependent phosphoesterase TrpH
MTMLSRADTHVHTYYSGYNNYKVLRFPESVKTPQQQVDNARSHGFDVLCVTDHDETRGAFVAKEYAKQFKDFEVVIGEEVTSSDGEVLAYFLNERVPDNLTIEETIDNIHGQGGLAVAPHPFSFYVPCLHDRIYDIKLDGIEVINGGHVDAYTNNMAQTVFANNPGRWAALSGSDAHSGYTMGFNWTEFPGSSAEDFRKAIINKKTVPCGKPAPVFTQVQWSMEVVIGAQKLIYRALLGKLKPQPDNPLITKIISLNAGKKIGGIIGGCLYLIPPIPFIGAGLSTTWLDKKSYKLLDQVEYKLEADKRQKMLEKRTKSSSQFRKKKQTK